MTKNIKLLAGLLVLQVVLAFFLLTRKDETGVFNTTEKLMTASFDKVNTLKIEDAEKKVLTLVKKDDNWTLPSLFDYPVQKDKITNLFASLKDLKKSWPAGKTQNSAKQFNVTDEKFERRLTLLDGENALQTLYLGGSPSFKKVHARVDKDNFTYVIDMNTYDLPADSKSWFDKDFHRVEKTDVKQLSIGGLNFENKNGQFELTGLAEKEETDPAKATMLLGTALKPSVEEVLGTDEKAAPKDHEVLQYTAEKNDGTKVEFVFYKWKATSEGKEDSDEKNFYVLKLSSHPYFYKVRKAQVEELFAVEKAKYIREKGKEEKKEEGAAPKDASSVTKEAAQTGEESKG